jgi:hypothetical protein
MNNLYAHPTITSSPDLIQALQERLGLLAIVQGSRVQLVDIPHRWRHRTAPRGIEQRGHAIVVLSPQDHQRRDDLPGRPQ